MATAIHSQFDFEFVTLKAWPEMPVKEKVKVLVGIKYLYTEDDIAGLMLGEDLPKRSDQQSMYEVYIGCVEHIPLPGLSEKIRQEIIRRSNTELCIVIFMSKNRKQMKLDWTIELDQAFHKVA